MRQVAGVPGLTPRDASAAMALVTAATEPRHEIVGFHAGRRGWRAGRGTWGHDGLTPLAISPRQRLDDAIRAVSDLPFGGTDCALPMLLRTRARARGRHVRGPTPTARRGRVRSTRSQALREYRRAPGSRRAWSWSGWSRTAFTIADPDDPGMLDVVGFDTATPEVISGFARGAL